MGKYNYLPKIINMKKLLFIFLLFNCIIGYSQNDEAFVDSQVAQKMAELEMQSNPEYFSRKDFCLGNIQMYVMPDGSNCSSTSTYYSVYVFWKEDELMKIQKFDNCGSFLPLAIGGEKLLKKVKSMKEDLKTEEVKPFENETKPQDTKGNMTVESCQKEYIFKLNGETFKKSFKEFDLSSDSKNKNVNAKYNNSLSLIVLDKEVSKLISELERKGKFFRQN